MSGADDLEFVEVQAVQEIAFTDVARFEIMDDGQVRLWLITTEQRPEGRVRVLVLKLITTMAGMDRNRERLTATMASRVADAELSLGAVH